MKGVTIEHHHKYSVGKVEENIHDSIAVASVATGVKSKLPNSNSKAAQAMSDLGAQAAATMNKLRGRGGEPHAPSMCAGCV